VLPFRQADIPLNGWAIESRLYAEDPYRNFLPSTGRLTRYRPPVEEQGPTHAVRNDTGVFEGGEISVFYDPMIAKLCTWAPERGQAIAGMGRALDAFEVEGIGHNLPFLSAVMDHPRFQEGRLTTGFIAEEWPDGFKGVTLPEPALRRVAAAAAAMYRVAEIRRTRVSGRMDNHERKVGTDWVVSLGGHDFPVVIAADKGGADVRFADGASLRVTSDWRPGETLARLMVGDKPLILKVSRITGGFRLRTRGADLRTLVRTPRAAELARLMPVKTPPDTSRLLLCPMPGLVVSVAVAEGETVEEGQPLATVEAMKMENILRAERRAVVSKVHAKPGDSLRVDDVILEFQ
jgi:propionyl-CoA carboxylase alpha chain